MNYVIIIHEVEDYAKWKTGFDNASGIRKAAWETSYQRLPTLCICKNSNQARYDGRLGIAVPTFQAAAKPRGRHS